MRGLDERSGGLLSCIDLEARVAMAHPLRPIRGIVNEALAELSPTFAELYAPLGTDRGFDAKDFVLELRERRPRQS
jgi:hypothetical protein